MSIIVKKEQVDFIIENQNKNNLICGPRYSGLTTMAILEAVHCLKTGKRAIVYVYSSLNKHEFLNKIQDYYYKIDSYIHSINIVNSKVEVFSFGQGKKEALGKNVDRIIFDNVFGLLRGEFKFWDSYAKNISIYTNNAHAEDLSLYNCFEIQTEQNNQQLNVCPRCNGILEKKTCEGLLFSTKNIDIMKCPNCGYCN